MEAFLELNDRDLKELGVKEREPRLQILALIDKLNSGKVNFKVSSLPPTTGKRGMLRMFGILGLHANVRIAYMSIIPNILNIPLFYSWGLLLKLVLCDRISSYYTGIEITLARSPMATGFCFGRAENLENYCFFA